MMRRNDGSKAGEMVSEGLPSSLCVGRGIKEAIEREAGEMVEIARAARERVLGSVTKRDLLKPGGVEKWDPDAPVKFRHLNTRRVR